MPNSITLDDLVYRSIVLPSSLDDTLAALAAKKGVATGHLIHKLLQKGVERMKRKEDANKA